jgi:rare lipoprotein A
VRFRGDDRNAAVSRTLRGKTYVLRPGHASWYGPGLYGNKLGCGGTLKTSTVGVANKSLPCGTKVVFRYKGRTATLPVIDRGPYVGGREWDLTAGAKRKLGFGSTGTVWTSR